MDNKLKTIHLNHDSYIALHVQLHNQLRQLIVSGQWQHGERIPSETQFARHLKISRTTVRIALQSAEIEGLITRAAGRGTFVSYKADEKSNPRFIGYVTRNFHNNIHRVMLSSVEAELRSAGYRLIFSNASNNDDEVVVLKQLLEENVTGLILWPNANPTQDQRDILQQYQALHKPIVFVDRFVDGIAADYVTSDNFGGTYTLVKHLIELGHEHIVYLRSNITGLSPVDERQRGYEAAIAEHGLHAYAPLRINSPHQNVFFETDIHELLDESSAELVDQVVTLLQQTTPRPTAIACVNDALAIIAVRALQKMQLRVPEDVSVVGFDDISLAAYMQVPLTTTRQDAYTIGTTAARCLVERLDGLNTAPRREIIPTFAKIRMSSTTPISSNDVIAQEGKEGTT